MQPRVIYPGNPHLIQQLQPPGSNEPPAPTDQLDLNSEIFKHLPPDLFVKVMEHVSADRWESVVDKYIRTTYSMTEGLSEKERKEWYKKHYEELHMVLDCSDNLAQKTVNRSSILIEALWIDNKALFNHCLKLPHLNGTIMKQTDPGGLSVISMAILSKHHKVIPTLLKHEAKPSPDDIMYASLYGQPELIEQELWPKLEENLAKSENNDSRAEHAALENKLLARFEHLIGEDEALKPFRLQFELDKDLSARGQFGQIKAKLLAQAHLQKTAISEARERDTSRKLYQIKRLCNSEHPVRTASIASLLAACTKQELKLLPPNLLTTAIKNDHANIVRLFLANRISPAYSFKSIPLQAALRGANQGALLGGAPAGAFPEELQGAPIGFRAILDQAIERKNIGILKVLLQYGANPNNYNPVKPFIHQAVKTGNRDLVKVLLEHDANINIINAAGETALHQAVKAHQKDMVALLLEHGANAHKRNKDGLNVLDLSTDKEITRLLKQKFSWRQRISNHLQTVKRGRKRLGQSVRRFKHELRFRIVMAVYRFSILFWPSFMRPPFVGLPPRNHERMDILSTLQTMERAMQIGAMGNYGIHFHDPVYDLIFPSPPTYRERALNALRGIWPLKHLLPSPARRNPYFDALVYRLHPHRRQPPLTLRQRMTNWVTAQKLCLIGKLRESLGF